MGKSCTKNLKVAKMKLFQLTPIRHAKSPGQADASFVLQIQVAWGRQLPPPRLFLSGAFSLQFAFDSYLVNFLRSSWFRTKSINNRSTVSLCLSLSRKELTCAKGRCGLLWVIKEIEGQCARQSSSRLCFCCYM